MENIYTIRESQFTVPYSQYVQTFPQNIYQHK